MNRALQWKLIAGFVLVFIAGGVTGGFFAAAQARHFLSVPRHEGMVAEHMRARLQRELKLTPEQVAQISPIIEKAGAELEDIRHYSGRRVRETFMKSHDEISGFLTDEQRTKLKRMESRHRRWHGPGLFGGRGGPRDHRPEQRQPAASASVSLSASPSP